MRVYKSYQVKKLLHSKQSEKKTYKVGKKCQFLWLVFRCPQSLISGTFLEVARSRGCDAGTDSWGNVRVKGTRMMGVSATHPK